MTYLKLKNRMEKSDRKIRSNSNFLIDTQNSACDALSSFYDSQIDSSEDRTELSRLMINLLESSQDQIITQESIQNLKQGINKLAEPSIISFPISPNRTPAQHEVDHLKSSYSRLKSDYSDLVEKDSQSKILIKNQQDEINYLQAEREKLNNSLSEQKNEYSKEVSDLKSKDFEFAEKYQDAVAKIKLLTDVEERHKNQLKLAYEEIDELTQKNKKLTAKVTQKNEELYQLKVQLKKKKIGIQEFQKQLSSLSSTFDSPISNSQEFQDMKDEMKRVKASLGSKSSELRAVKQTVHHREYLLDSNRKILELQNDEIIKNSTRIENLQQQIKKLQDDRLKDEVHHNEMKEMLCQKEQEMIEYRNILMNISFLLEPRFNIHRFEDIPSLVDTLLSESEKGGYGTIELMSTIDGMTRFIDLLLSNERADTNFLSKSPPILTDRKLLNQVVDNIKKTKKLLNEKHQLTINDNEMFDSLLSSKEDYFEQPLNNEYASLIVVTSANEKLRKVCIDQQKTIEEYSRICSIDHLDEFVKLLKTYEKTCQMIFKQQFGDSLSLLSYFVDNVSSFNQMMRKNVLSELNINPEFMDIPNELLSFFKEQSLSISGNDLKTQTMLSEVESKLDSSESKNIQLTNTNKKLTRRLSILVKEYKLLKEKYNQLESQQKSQNESLISMNNHSREIEENVKIATSEKERLEKLLEQNQRRTEARIEAMLKAEMDLHQEEIKRRENLWEKEKKELINKLNKKTQKYMKQHKTDQELIKFLEGKLKNSDRMEKPSVSSVHELPVDPKPKEVPPIADVDFIKILATELEKVVQIKGEWDYEKILSSIKKMVSMINLDDVEEDAEDQVFDI